MKQNRVKKAMVATILAISMIASSFATGRSGKVVYAASATNQIKQITLADMPSNFKASIDWVYQNRILKEDSISRQNLIYDQIIAGKGTLNYVVRWQSKKTITLQNRKDIEKMLGVQINNWTRYLVGYDDWPYNEITVKVVGWAVTDASLFLDKQPNEILYVNSAHDNLHDEDASIPELLPSAPSELSRFDHFRNKNYSYPGGLDKRFDMYLWCTTNYSGACGGDWGQRISEDWILDNVNTNEDGMMEHEIGHGFGITDFYGEDERPPMGFPVGTIMWAWNREFITTWDAWMLRYIWSHIKTDTNRFPASIYQNACNDEGILNVGVPYEGDRYIGAVNGNIASQAKATSSFCSSWETISALNDGVLPANSADRTKGAYGNYPKYGESWVMYTFPKAYKISETSIYWYQDAGGLVVPEKYKIQYLDSNNKWRDVTHAEGYGTKLNVLNKTYFNPVETTAIRVFTYTSGYKSTGMHEWQVGYSASQTEVTTPTPTTKPTTKPTATPKPTLAPTVKPTATPKPTVAPTVKPTQAPVVIANRIEKLATVTTSYCSPWETITALNDGATPSDCNDKSNGAYGNWPETGAQWVQYTFDKTYQISETNIYWFKDYQGIEIPSSYSIQYLDGNGNWVNVRNAKGLGTENNTFNKSTFDAVNTTAIRVVMNSTGTYSTGILEWQVGGTAVSVTTTPTTSPKPTVKPTTTPSETRKTWTFGTSRFNGISNITSDKAVDGLTLHATIYKPMIVKTVEKTLDGTKYSKCLALGGMGCDSYRSVEFTVNGSCTISVAAMSNGNNTRYLKLCDAKGNVLDTFACGKKLAKYTYEYTGNATELYLYSANSGINIYEIKVQ